ncbi:unnamed protein product [Mytilus coruscus]|uniref:Transposable element P transposase-like RNase H domain-containing protein n=1 Tax=Mytilus coruscus TaxID=42192 RepID=A0A6J8D223_MYTCO|nr:unnamed protein product [Mytilus coruscus]
MLCLPAKSTFIYYKNCIKQKPGINHDNLTWMKKEAERQQVSFFGHRGGLLLDEMSIQDDIEVTRKGDAREFVGTVDMGQTNNTISTITNGKKEVAQPDDLSNCTIDQSQSILTTADETNVALQKTDSPAARPKVFPARKTGPTNKLTNPDPAKQTRNTGQLQMTQFMHVTNQESRPTRKKENKQVNTPAKSTSEQH